MLPQSERLKKSSEFSTIYGSKRSVANSLLVLYVGKHRSASAEATRAGFVVSKKIDKRSAVRNRIKRLMREAYKRARANAESPVHEWGSLIFLARPGILEQNLDQVYNAIEDTLSRARQRFSKVK